MSLLKFYLYKASISPTEPQLSSRIACIRNNVTDATDASVRLYRPFEVIKRILNRNGWNKRYKNENI